MAFEWTILALPSPSEAGAPMTARVETSSWPLPANGQRFITPPRLRRLLARQPLSCGCYPLALGFYPEAAGHLMQRSQPEDHLLIYCRAGRGWLETADGRFEVGGGDLLLLPKGLAHRYGADAARPWTLYWVHFDGSLAEGRAAQVARYLPLGIGPEANVLARIAAGVLWCAALFSALLSLDRLFAADLRKLKAMIAPKLETA